MLLSTLWVKENINTVPDKQAPVAPGVHGLSWLVMVHAGLSHGYRRPLTFPVDFCLDGCMICLTFLI